MSFFFLLTFSLQGLSINGYQITDKAIKALVKIMKQVMMIHFSFVCTLNFCIIYQLTLCILLFYLYCFTWCFHQAVIGVGICRLSKLRSKNIK